MGSFSIWHWLVVGILVLLLFGRGRFSEMMGDVAKGIKSFKKGMAEDDEQPRTEKRVEALDKPRDLTAEKDKTEEQSL
jgi:sec-independent protein translocase protein TatA